MTWDDVTEKFVRQAEPVLGAKRASLIASRASAIEREPDIGSFAELLGGVAPTDKLNGSRLKASAVDL